MANLPEQFKENVASYMRDHGWEDCTPEIVQIVYDSRKAQEMPVTAALAGNIMHELEKADLLK